MKKGLNVELPQERIEKSILLIRKLKVILDEDLASLYQVKTKVLVQAIKRNIERFPEDFMFQLTTEEYEVLRSQIVTSKGKTGRRYAPYVFTEQGVAMLSSVLNSPRAIAVNVQIMRTFVALRQAATNSEALTRRLDALEGKYDAQFKVVFNSIRELINAKPKDLPSVPANKRLIGFGRT